MGTINSIIFTLQTILYAGFAVRIVICCVKLSHSDEHEKIEHTKKIKHTLAAAVIVTVVFTIKALIEQYYR